MMGLILPTALILVQRLGSPLQGTAAALQGFLNYAFGAALSPVPALAGVWAVTALGALMMTLFVISAVLVWLLMRRYPRRAPIT